MRGVPLDSASGRGWQASTGAGSPARWPWALSKCTGLREAQEAADPCHDCVHVFTLRVKSALGSLCKGGTSLCLDPVLKGLAKNAGKKMGRQDADASNKDSYVNSGWVAQSNPSAEVQT